VIVTVVDTTISVKIVGEIALDCEHGKL